MTTVLVPNIILTNNPRIAEAFNINAEKFTSFSAFKNSLEEEFSSNQYVTLTTENTEITKFEFSIQGNKKDSESPFCVFEFIQTGKSFELELLRTQVKKIVNTDGEEDFPKPLYFCAYGVGDDLSYWSNFASLVLIDANVFQSLDQPKTIQLNFAVGSGFHENFDSLLNSLINTETLSKVGFSPAQNAGRMHGFADYYFEETKPKNQKQRNSYLLGQYLLGFNGGDAAYKKTINSFLRANFQQKANVFFISDDLRALAINKTIYDKIEDKKKVKNDKLIADTTKKGAQIDYLGPRCISLDSRTAFFSNTSLYTAYLEQVDPILKVIQDNFGIEGFIDGGYFDNFFTEVPDLTKVEEEVLGRSGFIYEPIFQTSLAVSEEDEDNSDLEAKKETLKKTIVALSDGLSPEKGLGENEVILIKECDKTVISFFIDLLDDELKKLIPLNPNLPLILLGDSRLIRSMVYGERYKDGDSSRITGNLYVDNEKARAYFSTEWKDLDLYGSHPSERAKNSLESLLDKDDGEGLLDGYRNFPIFRYNVTNPNILSLSIEENKLFYSLLYTGYVQVPKLYDEFKLNISRVDEDVKDLLDLYQDLGKKARYVGALVESKRQSEEAKAIANASDIQDKVYQSIVLGYVDNKNLQAADPLDSTTVPEIRAQAQEVLELLERDDTLLLDIINVAKEEKFKLESGSIFRPNTRKEQVTNIINKQLNLKNKIITRQDYRELLEKDNIITSRTSKGIANAQIRLEQLQEKQNESRIDNLKELYDKKFSTRIGSYQQYLIVRQAIMNFVVEGGSEAFGKLKNTTVNDKYQTPVYYTGTEYSDKEPNFSDKDDSEKPIVRTYTLGRILSTQQSIIKEIGSLYSFKKNNNPYEYMDTAVIYANLINNLKSIPITLEIETLPFFNISNMYWLGYPCLVYAERPKLIGNSYKDALDPFISGHYLILGMKHVITSNKCYSKFVLIRKRDLELEKEINR